MLHVKLTLYTKFAVRVKNFDAMCYSTQVRETLNADVKFPVKCNMLQRCQKLCMQDIIILYVSKTILHMMLTCQRFCTHNDTVYADMYQDFVPYV